MTKSKFKIIAKGLTDASQAQRGNNIYYHCGICQEYISSRPRDNTKCKCGNVVIDIDYVRLFVKDFCNFTVVQKL